MVHEHSTGQTRMGWRCRQLQEAWLQALCPSYLAPECLNPEALDPENA